MIQRLGDYAYGTGHRNLAHGTGDWVRGEGRGERGEGNWEQGTINRATGTGNREQGTLHLAPGTWHLAPGTSSRLLGSDIEHRRSDIEHRTFITMAIPLLQLVNLVILLVLLIFLVRYIWDLFFGDSYEPVEWEMARKKKAISPILIREMRKYEDKVRFFAFWLQIERMKRDAIKGSFAELGVYKGETARLLHLMDPGRVLHLLDTFEGLPDEDLKQETGEAATYSNKNFKDTTVSRVLQKIGGDPSRIRVHQGHFPGSSSGLENETFAFVSLDADLYNPTLEGLRFFYPRLSPGGVLFVHDYNHKWEGLVKAFDEFSATIPEVPALIPDLYGTVLIVKSRENS